MNKASGNIALGFTSSPEALYFQSLYKSMERSPQECKLKSQEHLIWMKKMASIVSSGTWKSIFTLTWMHFLVRYELNFS